MATKTAAPQNSAEDRYVNRMRAGDSTKTDAELRQQYRDKMSGRSETAFKSVAAAKPKISSSEAAGRALADNLGRDWNDMGGYERQQYIDEAAKGETSSKARRITPKRRAAMAAYKKAFGVAPPKSMTIKKMHARVDSYASMRQTVDGVADAMKPFKAGNKGAKSGGKARASRVAPSQIANARDGSDFMRPDPAKAARLQNAWSEKIARARTLDDIAGRSAARNAQILNERFGPVTSSQWSGPSTAQKMWSGYIKAQPALAAYGAGVQAAHAYKTARSFGASPQQAMKEAAKEAAVPLGVAAATMAAKPIERGAGKVAKTAFDFAGSALGMSSDNMAMEWATGYPLGKIGMASGAVGVLAKGVQIAAKAVSRVALPAVLGYSAFHGASEDKGSRVRGAARGIVRGLDPTSMFMATGVGERLFDSAFGHAPQPSIWEQHDRTMKYREGSAGGNTRLTGDQQQQFAQANAAYRTANDPAAAEKKKDKKGGRGFANAKTQMAAQEGRGVANFTSWAQSGDNYPGGA